MAFKQRFNERMVFIVETSENRLIRNTWCICATGFWELLKRFSNKKSIKSFKPAFLLVFSKSEISPKEPPEENFAISLPALLKIYENYV